ncbi:hypothetical protein P5673_002551 [Acropora cervicornis]|uniref:Uncharacterized protein n=1 Tax=Acropora cervicornis TaxID=6130 RepID=A0AAD9R388_ACRCE|nr:hypothetical protein P5673_002551 [Acropora cervicornis]
MLKVVFSVFAAHFPLRVVFQLNHHLIQFSIRLWTIQNPIFSRIRGKSHEYIVREIKRTANKIDNWCGIMKES